MIGPALTIESDMFAAFAFMIMFVIIALLTRDFSEGLQTLAAIFVAPVGLFGCVGSLVLLVFHHFVGIETPKKRIENELQMCTKRE